MDANVLAAVNDAFPAGGAVVLGAPVHGGECHPQPAIGLQLAMLTRHGLIAGATGTGKTKTLQLLAEQLSAAGVPVFLADMKGDLSGMAAAGETNARIAERSQAIGYPWQGRACPVEFLSLTGTQGAQLRATVSSFGPLLLAKVMGLNETQTSVMSLLFKYCDDRKLPLLDFADLRAVLLHLSGDGADDLKAYGGMSKASVGVMLREIVELEQQGADSFFGEPAFDLDDLLQTDAQGQGLVSILSLSDLQDRPALFSTFMLWMLAQLYNDLPEVGDLDKPKLVFFFDEAHLLFEGASKTFLEQVERVVRLIRSKGVGIVFVTQSPKDIPADILGQLGNRIQHALRAFTADDEKALKAAARTFPKTPYYAIDEVLTTLGIGEALVTTLSRSGSPTPPFVTRIAPPSSRMGPLTPEELARQLSASEQVKAYAQTIDRESAREMLAKRMAPAAEAADDAPRPEAEVAEEAPQGDSTFAKILKSPLVKTVVTEVTRGLLGALLGTPSRRRRR